MSLRTRIGGAAALAVAGVVIAVAIAVYVADRSELRGQVDRSLTDFARPFSSQLRPPGVVPGVPGVSGGADSGPPPQGGDGAFPNRRPLGRFGGPSGYLQFIASNGTVRRPSDETRPLPVDKRARTVAETGRGQYFDEATVDGVHLRVLTVADPDGGAVQVARPLTEVDHALDRLLFVVLIVGVAGIALAALLGALVARAALAPVARFTRRTEALTANPDPSQRLEEVGRDELARLAHSFNATLDALSRSVRAQRHLVADASHELRTPIASLRANIQVLGDADRLPEAERESLRADIIEELDSLTALVADVVDLARGAEPQTDADDVALDEVVESAVHRARRRASEIGFRTEVEQTLVRGAPDRIGRAVANLIDNAIRWSPPGGEVDVTLRDGVLSIRDHGPGFAEKDLPHVFDRFYRADEARRMPGSGLGLAIVRQAAEAHGGYARASNAPDGGARLEVFFGAPVSTADKHAPGVAI